MTALSATPILAKVGTPTTARRLAGLVNTVAASGNKVVPTRQRLIFRTKPVGTAFGQPIERSDALPVEQDAIHHAALAVGVIGAPAIAPVEEFASDIGRVDESGVFVLKLVQTTAAATVAQGLPLAAIELGEGFFPKRFRIGHDKFRHALLSALLQGAGDEKVRGFDTIHIDWHCRDSRNAGDRSIRFGR